MSSEIPFAFSKINVSSTPKSIEDMGLHPSDVTSATVAYITTTAEGLWFRFDTTTGDPGDGDHYLPENETILLENTYMIQNFRAVAASGTAKVAVTLCR